MRSVFALLVLLSVLFSQSESRSRKGSKTLIVQKYVVGATKDTSKPSHAITSAATAMVSTTTAKPTTNENLVKTNSKVTTIKPTKKVLRMYPYNYRQRKCCKQGYRAGKRGYNCDINRHFASRVTNMEHRAKMKFQGGSMNSVDRKLIKRIVRYCIKGPGYKALYKKCCSTAKK